MIDDSYGILIKFMNSVATVSWYMLLTVSIFSVGKVILLLRNQRPPVSKAIMTIIPTMKNSSRQVLNIWLNSFPPFPISKLRNRCVAVTSGELMNENDITNAATTFHVP